MRAGFLQLAKEFPDRIRIVNGNQSVEDLSEEIYGVVQETLL
jgi:thymidylate kinase